MTKANEVWQKSTQPTDMTHFTMDDIPRNLHRPRHQMGTPTNLQLQIKVSTTSKLKIAQIISVDIHKHRMEAS